MDPFFARNRLSALIDGDLSEEEEQELRAAVAADPALAAELAQMEEALGLLRDVGPTRAPAGFEARVMAEVNEGAGLGGVVVRLRAFAQAHGVGPQHLEGPQVRALAEVVQVLVADQRGHHTRSMYWPMVRSTLKGPMPAMLRSARSAHAGRLANSASTSSWVRT